jgi:hypothetical protein
MIKPILIKPKEHQHMRRKILMGVLALALPVGSLFALETSAVAKTVVPPNGPVNCTVAGTVTFAAPGLSKEGTVTTAKTSSTNATTHFTGCGSSAALSVSIVSKNTKCKGANDPSGTACEAKHTDVYDTESGFASTGTASIAKSLKKLSFTVDGVTYGTKTTSATAASCTDSVSPPGGVPTETGFKVSGEVKTPKNDKGQITTLIACLGTDTGPGTSGSFLEDLGSGIGTIATAAIDGNTSTLSIS